LRSLKIKTDKVYYKKVAIEGSRLGLPLLMLKITAGKKSKKRKRKAIIIIARQHPGETPSSYVCQGLIKFLLSDNPQSQFLI
jgi:hypothetical protein